MSHGSVSSSIDERFQQVRDFLSLIKAREGTEQPSTSSDTKTLRGLFYVHLYSAFEFSINHSIQNTLQLAAQKKVKLNELESRFLTVGLNHLFQAYPTIKSDKRWKKRIEIFDSISSDKTSEINNTLFGEYLQNIWTNTLIDVCTCICLPASVLPSPRERQYIDELVDTRNKVAHGRESAHNVGERTNGIELETRFNIIKDVTDRVVNAQVDLIENSEFVIPESRSSYQTTHI
ncbi:MAG: MAE_28990/MAE_18760 family HEPN-like nuclease [Rhodoferax sp.]|uniref:MAE_28990/MAE_18760 family HEPN-like nuclease n=1 Tax=Rhodoferax sp. TaxID=50421 RepID=UPI002ACD60EE|nr:MAE_28990/MAE_18760 family HEPN-like nuclease [Rhodoferax sp.]MDZ7892954.1 MAE_28990/MAE_18760 family HEPN-like nuclease [Rhodoferax sp.]